MLNEFTRSELGPKTTLYTLNTDKYRTNTVRFYYKHELKPGDNTMTALAMRLLQHGSASYPSRLALARQLETLYGAHLGTGVGKVGGYQLAYVHLEVAAERFLPNADGLFARALDTALEVMTKPQALAQPPEEGILTQESEYLSRDIRSLVDDKARYSLVRCNQEMFGPAPYALSEAGTLEDLRGVEGEQLPDHYRHLLAHADMNVFMVGQFSPGDVEALKEVAALREDQMPLEPVPVPPVRDKPHQRTEEADVTQARICLGLRAVAELNESDYYPLVMYNGILGGFPHSKLFVNLREKAHLAYDVWSFVSSMPPVQYIMAGVHPEQYQQALEIMEEQRREVREGRFNSSELEATRKAVINRIRGITDTPERLIGATISNLLAQRTAGKDEQIAAFKGVEPQDVVRVAEKLQLDTTMVLLPRRSEQPS